MVGQVELNVRRGSILLKKSFPADERNFFKTADALCSPRREGVSLLASVAAAETSKHRLSRDF
jgi:hypothetical protein